jgi:hypothetical protein
MHRTALQAALEAATPGRSPQDDLLIAQAVRCETIMILGFNHLDRDGIISKAALARSEIAFQPVLRDLLAAMNTQRQALQALGLSRRVLEERILMPWEIGTKAGEQGKQAEEIKKNSQDAAPHDTSGKEEPGEDED